MVLLIGNYPADRQQSMQRFATMMLHGLRAAGIRVELIQPAPLFGNLKVGGHLVAKWLGYVDKFLLFPRRLRKVARRAAVVHVCDHSNAMYSKRVKGAPVVVTCHDLLAVRGALGEQTDCPASVTGKMLQKWILSGLSSATAVACDSDATLLDAERLVRRRSGKPALELITLGLSYPYRRLEPEEVSARLGELPQLTNSPFVLHVGSNLRRKNREGVLRIFSRCAAKWDGVLVFAGDPLAPHMRVEADELGISDRLVEVPSPSNELLEGLYNRATALLYPSRFEGFGWPIAEAQACGCPVLCSDAEPMREVSGGAALLRQVDDEEGFAADLLRLAVESEHAIWRERSLHNAKRFDAAAMVAHYLKLYRTIGARL
ncbi:MAG: glycosyltransferase family 4 protein [Chthoniobacterales bacterium]